MDERTMSRIERLEQANSDLKDRIRDLERRLIERLIDHDRSIDALERKQTAVRLENLVSLLMDYDPELEGFHKLRVHDALFLDPDDPEDDAIWQNIRQGYRNARRRGWRGYWARRAGLQK